MSSPNYMYGKIPAEAPDAEWVRRDYKFNEENLINEIKRYIDQTYEGHYSKNQFQSSEFIMDCGHGMGFFLGNILLVLFLLILLLLSILMKGLKGRMFFLGNGNIEGQSVKFILSTNSFT